MTTQQFCNTNEELVEQEYNKLTLPRYYRKNMNITDLTQWNEIVYIPSNGRIELYDDETLGQILPKNYWEIYTVWDIITELLGIGYTLDEAVNKIPRLYDNMHGQSMEELITGTL